MTWRVEWMLRRAEALTDEERAALVAHAAAERDHPWQIGRYPLIILGFGGLGPDAGGTTNMPEDLSHPDWSFLLGALTRLRGVVPGATCQVVDSHGLIAWNEELGRYDTRGWDRPTPAPPPPAPSLGEIEGRVRALYAETLGDWDRTYELARKLEADPDPEVVSRVGLELLATLPPDDYAGRRRGRDTIRSVLRDTLPKVEDLTGVASELRALYAARRDSPHAEDVTWALDRVAARPLVLELARADLEDSGAPTWKVAASSRLLGGANAAAGEVMPWLVARARREGRGGGAWRLAFVNAISWLRRPEGFATLLFEAEADRELLDAVATGLARCGGNRALPWILRLRHTTVSHTSLVRAVGEIDTPAATDVLCGFLSEPLPGTRTAAAQTLAQRGRLAEAAAAWRTLDAAGHEAGWERQQVLELFGAASATAVDWDALVRARGLAPLPLPAVPPPLERLTRPTRDVRAMTHMELGKQPRAEHLLALALSEELEVVYARFGVPAQTVGWYNWRAVLDPLGAPEDSSAVSAWIRAHVPELPPQALTAELELIRDRGAEALVERWESPIFKLSDAERALFDAEEAEVAARAGAPRATPPEAPGADDLFESMHPEDQGAFLGDPGDGEIAIVPSAGDLLPAGTARDGLVELDPGAASLSWKRNEGLVFFTLLARVWRHVRRLRLDAVELRVRDRDGVLLFGASQREEKLLRPVARLVFQAWLPVEQADLATSVEARAVVREPFQEIAARWQLPELAGAEAGRCPLVRLHEGRAVRASAACHFDGRRPVAGLAVVVELCLTRPAVTAPPVAVILAVRSAAGQVLARGITDVILPADQSTAVVQRTLALGVDELGAARFLDVAVRGARTVVEPLATFALAADAS